MIQAEIMNGEKGKVEQQTLEQGQSHAGDEEENEKGKSSQETLEALTTDAQKGGTAIT